MGWKLIPNIGRIKDKTTRSKGIPNRNIQRFSFSVKALYNINAAVVMKITYIILATVSIKASETTSPCPLNPIIISKNDMVMMVNHAPSLIDVLID